MTSPTPNLQQSREQLIEQLACAILDQARPHIDTSAREEELKKVMTDISERLQFESNVALSELVTRLA